MAGRVAPLVRIAVAALACVVAAGWAETTSAAGDQAAASPASRGLPAPASFADNPRVITHYEARTALFADYPPLDGGVAFVGDSLTEGGDWAALFPGVPLRNYGISGDRAEGVLARHAQIVAARPGRILLMIGTNNLSRGVSPAAVDADVSATLDRFRAALPGTQLVVQSVLPRQPQFDAAIRELNDRLRQTAARHGAAFVDLHPAFVVDGGRLDPAVTADELHLTSVGYARWAGLIGRCVREGACG
ncbi:hypothetical protein HCU40_25440 [Pseudanabaena biceps]|nr:hypothetical protein [Pseudanabaena biceps]